jgi:hypothetical protein
VSDANASGPRRSVVGVPGITYALPGNAERARAILDRRLGGRRRALAAGLYGLAALATAWAIR